MQEAVWQDPRDATRWTLSRLGEPPERVYLLFWSTRGIHHLVWPNPKPFEALSDAELIKLLERAQKGPWAGEDMSDAVESGEDGSDACLARCAK